MSLRTKHADCRPSGDGDRGGRPRPAHRWRAAPATTSSAQAERSVGFFWTPAKTQLYAVLRKLVENGFATARRVRQSRPAGQDALPHHGRRRGPAARRAGASGSAVNKNPLELRIFFGEHRPLEAVVADLEAVRDNGARISRARGDRAHVRPRRVPVSVPDAAARQGERGGRRGVGRAGARVARAPQMIRLAVVAARARGGVRPRGCSARHRRRTPGRSASAAPRRRPSR